MNSFTDRLVESATKKYWDIVSVEKEEKQI